MTLKVEGLTEIPQHKRKTINEAIRLKRIKQNINIALQLMIYFNPFTILLPENDEFPLNVTREMSYNCF